MRAIFLTILIFIANSCGNPEYPANCDNLLPASQAQFSDVYALFSTSREDSCGGCHSTSHPALNYDLQSRAGVYDALTNHFDIVYGQIASGSMPPEDETKWSNSDLKILSTWYCNGGFYEN